MSELAIADSLTDETRAEMDELETGTADLERQLRAAQAAVDLEEDAQRHCAMAVRPGNGTPRRRSRENRNG